jgi:hypothetical protein
MAKDTRLLGFNFTKINVEKNPKFSGNLKVKSNINIKSIEKHKLELAKQDSLRIEFVFDVDYGNLGKINLNGVMFITSDLKQIKDTLSKWKDTKATPTQLQVAIMNIILQKTSLKALELEEEIGLPHHIQLPRLQQKT